MTVPELYLASQSLLDPPRTNHAHARGHGRCGYHRSGHRYYLKLALPDIS